MVIHPKLTYDYSNFGGARTFPYYGIFHFLENRHIALIENTKITSSCFVNVTMLSLIRKYSKGIII